MNNPENAPPQQEKKIIVDEDWKAQVQAEKEQFERQQAQKPADTPRAERPTPPPASLAALATSLSTQALLALGLIADSPTAAGEADLDSARYLIDTLAMLQEKTQGNRTPEETAILDNLLHELRLGFFAVHERCQTSQPPT